MSLPIPHVPALEATWLLALFDVFEAMVKLPDLAVELVGSHRIGTWV